jgi:lipopolysaccharide transport system ATP-binding protein
MNTDKIAIHVRGLGKRYRLGETHEVYRTFRDMLATLPAWLRHKSRERRAAKSGPWDPETPPGTFWALRDIDLDVQEGAVLGIVGRNGAGKSTLLKILARITEPTRGRAEIHGRVGSLLEVGTGFHLELSGRENIFLSGAILGMRKAEIRRKFDAIVDFAGVETFLDTPVKRYSNGMRVRLAFAVAAHLEPEILIVDEVLSVGDAEFQKKCVGKMKDVAGGGRTVLFVSHNMQAVKALCDSGILLEHGRIVHQGPVADVVEAYLARAAAVEPGMLIPPERHRRYPCDFEVFRVDVLNRHGEPTGFVLMEEPFGLRLHCRVRQSRPDYAVSIQFRRDDGLVLGTVGTSYVLDRLEVRSGGAYTLTARLKNVFSPGQCRMDVRVVAGPEEVDYVEGIPLTVAPVTAGDELPQREGVVQLRSEWSLDEEDAAPAPQGGP